MSRLSANLITFATCVFLGAGIGGFGDYFDVIFGSSSHSHRSSWKTIDNDSWANFKSRVFWGSLIGAGFGTYGFFARVPKDAPDDPNDSDRPNSPPTT